MRSLSRDQVRAVDRCAIEVLGVSGAVLMENAGRNAVDAIESFFFAGAGCESRSVAIVAGGGNNGGDGYVMARHLAMRGAKVVTFLVAPRKTIRGDALANLEAIEKLGHDVRALADDGEMGTLGKMLVGFDVVVDAVGGTGIRGPLREEMAMVVEQINAADRPVAAVDIPTGLDCDTGLADGPAVVAEITVTFVARKKGFDVSQSMRHTGEIVVVDIGVPADLISLFE